MSSPSSDPAASMQRLGVGVTGHRLDRLGTGATQRVREAIGAVLMQIERAVDAPDRPLPRLITSLADGADSIAADCALERGWQIDAILPFAREDYADDFTECGRTGEFERLLAASTTVMELAEPRDPLASGNIAYERAGRVLLAQSDILIAVWDGGPVRGRGGAAQIVAEAVQLDVPVIQIDPGGGHEPVLLWDGLEELSLGLDTVDSVARGPIANLPALVTALCGQAVQPSVAAPKRRRRWSLALGYPLLLAGLGVRRLRKSDVVSAGAQERSLAEILPLCRGDEALGGRLHGALAPQFARADAEAARLAQLFRHGYVANFALAALAVLLSLLGLALPAAAKPVLIAAELLIIASILIRTRRGNRAGWHHGWLDSRALAERLRCLAISARLGDLNLRGANQLGVGQRQHDWVAAASRDAARAIALPAARIDAAYLAPVRQALFALIDGQLAYLDADTQRMHLLEHRMHRLGSILFAATALSCLGFLGFKLFDMVDPQIGEQAHGVAIGATILSAALPAFGAAIYGIRMQGDFAGSAERSADLAIKLRFLRGAIKDGEPQFDNLSRCARGVTSLLTADIASWLHTTSARPLALPG